MVAGKCMYQPMAPAQVRFVDLCWVHSGIQLYFSFQFADMVLMLVVVVVVPDSLAAVVVVVVGLTDNLVVVVVAGLYKLSVVDVGVVGAVGTVGTVGVVLAVVLDKFLLVVVVVAVVVVVDVPDKFLFAAAVAVVVVAIVVVWDKVLVDIAAAAVEAHKPFHVVLVALAVLCDQNKSMYYTCHKENL